MTDDFKAFVVVTFIAVVVDVVLVDEATGLVPHCKLFVVLSFDAVTPYVVDVLDSRVIVAFHLAMYLAAVAV